MASRVERAEGATRRVLGGEVQARTDRTGNSVSVDVTDGMTVRDNQETAPRTLRLLQEVWPLIEWSHRAGREAMVMAG